MSTRKPKHPSHANTETEEARAATAAEVHHSGDLIAQGFMDVKDGAISDADEDGFETVSFKRKLHPALTEE